MFLSTSSTNCGLLILVVLVMIYGEYNHLLAYIFVSYNNNM